MIMPIDVNKNNNTADNSKRYNRVTPKLNIKEFFSDYSTRKDMSDTIRVVKDFRRKLRILRYFRDSDKLIDYGYDSHGQFNMNIVLETVFSISDNINNNLKNVRKLSSIVNEELDARRKRNKRFAAK